MFENDISELVLSFEQWIDFESRLQQNLTEMEAHENAQSVDFTSEIKQVYVSTTKAIKTIEKVSFLDIHLEMETRRADFRLFQGNKLPTDADNRGLGASTFT